MQGIEEDAEECFSTVYLDYDEGYDCCTRATTMSLASCYHPLYLQRKPIEFMFPIRFEEGMGYEECEKYYASMQDGSLRGKSVRSPRHKTKAEIQQEAKGALRSCLRKPKRALPEKSSGRVSIRRNSSFSEAPSELQSAGRSSCLPVRELKPWTSLRDMSEGPRVAFEPHIHVITIYPFYEYPDDVWSSIWSTPDQMMRMIRQATKEQRKEEGSGKREFAGLTDEVHMICPNHEDDIDEMLELENTAPPQKKRTFVGESDGKFNPLKQQYDDPCSDWMSDSETVCTDMSDV